MTSSPRIPPSAPPPAAVQAPVDRSTAVTPVLPSAPVKPVIRDSAVIVLPEELRREIQVQAQIRIAGTVVENIVASGEMRIRTESGDVVIRTETQIPPGTEVRITLSGQAAAAALADVALTPHQAEAPAGPSPVAAPPRPQPLKSGDTVAAVYVPAQTPPSAPPAPPAEKIIPPDLVASVFTAIRQAPAAVAEAIAKFTQIPEAVSKIFFAPDIHQALTRLPAAEQKTLFSFITAPETLHILRRFLPPETHEALRHYAPPVPPPAPLAHVLQASPEDEASILQALLPRPSPPPLPSSTAPVAGERPEPLSAFISILEHFALPQRQDSVLVPPGGHDTARLALPQNMQQVRVISVLPQGAPVPPSLQSPLQEGAPPPLIGKVDLPTPSGFPVIRTAQGDFVLKTSSPLPPGSTVVFEAAPMAPEQVLAAFSGAQATDTDPFLSLRWPAMEETLQILATGLPDAAQLLRSTLPSTAQPQRIAPAALLFLAALRLGDLGSWLGEPSLQALRQSGRKDLMDRLSGDFGKLSVQSREAGGGGPEWRPVFLPLLHQDQIYNLQFMVRQQQGHDKKEDEDGAKPATRFILNLHLSRMGDMQLDGFLHKKRLDLILRSGDALPFSMRQEIMQRFYAGLDQVRMQGAISFQTRQGWVNVESGHHAGTVA